MRRKRLFLLASSSPATCARTPPEQGQDRIRITNSRLSLKEWIYKSISEDVWLQAERSNQADQWAEHLKHIIRNHSFLAIHVAQPKLPMSACRLHTAGQHKW